MTHKRGDPGPRPAWEAMTCHFCGGRIAKGQSVQWSYPFQFWGHPVCVRTAEDTEGP